jgi:hypothetical protein
MPTVYEHIVPFEKRAIVYFKDRLQEIKKEMEALADEHAFLTEIVRNLNPCPACKGYGEFTEVIDQDDSRTIKCQECGGSGTRNS